MKLGQKGIPDRGSSWGKGKEAEKPGPLFLRLLVCIRGKYPLVVNVKVPEAALLVLLTPISSFLSRSCLFLIVDWFAAASYMRCQIQTAPRG